MPNVGRLASRLRLSWLVVSMACGAGDASEGPAERLGTSPAASPDDPGRDDTESPLAHDAGLPTDDAVPVVAAAPARGPCMPSAGSFARIYDPSPSPDMPWYINDHTVLRDQDGLWHLIGITHAEPRAPSDERELAHATSPTLTTPTWTRQPPALVVDEAAGESVLWAPYVLFHDGVYHMYYSAGGEPAAFQIKHATSSDLWSWQRDAEPLFLDGAYARDPHVMRIGAQWVMYYTATSEPDGGNYVVAYRTSRDLVRWSKRKIAYRDPIVGREAGNTESPQIVARPEGYYLFIGPRIDLYVSTEVFFSRDPFHFQQTPLTWIEAHAPEILQDLDGSQWITRCGWDQGGVDIAPLTWNCE